MKLGFIIIFLILTNPTNAGILELRSENTHLLGEKFNVYLYADTEGESIYGIDIRYMNYDFSKIRFINLTTTSYIPNIEFLNDSNGKILLSLNVPIGSFFNGNSIIATLIFNATSLGNSNITMDFMIGNTTDTNLASDIDLLTEVHNLNLVITDKPIFNHPNYHIADILSELGSGIGFFLQTITKPIGTFIITILFFSSVAVMLLAIIEKIKKKSGF